MNVSLFLLAMIALSGVASVQAVDSVFTAKGTFLTYKAGTKDMQEGGRTITIVSDGGTFVDTMSTLLGHFKNALVSVTYPSSPPANSLTHADVKALFTEKNIFLSTDKKTVTVTFPAIPNYSTDKDEEFKIDGKLLMVGGASFTCAATNCFAQSGGGDAVFETKTADDYIPAITQIGGTAFYYGASKKTMSVGGQTILIKLSGSKWASSVPASEVQAMITGSLALANSWENVKSAILDEHIDRVSDTMLRIRLPAIASYDNGGGTETLSVKATANAVTTASIAATYETISVVASDDKHWIESVSGTFKVFPPSEADIQAGGRRIVLKFGHTDGGKLKSQTDLRASAAITKINSIIESAVVADGELKTEVGAKLVATDIFRTADNTLTIVLPATVSAAYNVPTNDYTHDWVRFNIGDIAALFQTSAGGAYSGVSMPPVSVMDADAKGLLLIRPIPQEFTDVDGITLKVIKSTVRVPCLETVGGTFHAYPPTVGDIRKGNRYIRLTLSGTSWTDPLPVEEVRNMLSGDKGTGATVWNALKSNIHQKHVTRESDTVAHIEIPAMSTYDPAPENNVYGQDEVISVTVTGNAIGSTTDLATSSVKLTVKDQDPQLRTPAITSVSGTFFQYDVKRQDLKVLGGRTIIIKIDGTILDGSTYKVVSWANGASGSVALSDFKTNPLVKNWIKGGSSAAIIDTIVSSDLAQEHLVRTSDQTLTITLPADTDGALADDLQVAAVNGECQACLTNPPTGGIIQGADVADVPAFHKSIKGSADEGAAHIRKVSGTFVIFPPKRDDIRNGARSFEIEVGNCAFVTTVTGAMAQTMLTSTEGGTGPTRWNTLRSAIKDEHVIRLSNTKIRITLPAMPRYVNGDHENTGSDDFIQVSVPDSALTTDPGLKAFDVTFKISNENGNTPAIISLTNTLVEPRDQLNIKDLEEGCFERLQIKKAVDGTTNTITIDGAGTCMNDDDKVVLKGGDAIGVDDGVYKIKKVSGDATSIQLKDSNDAVVPITTACDPCTTASKFPTLLPFKPIATTRRLTIKISGDKWKTSFSSDDLAHISKAADDVGKMFNGKLGAATSFDTVFTAAAAKQCVAESQNAGGCLLLSRNSDTELTIIFPPFTLGAAEDIIVTVPKELLQGSSDIAVHSSLAPDQPTGLGVGLDFRFSVKDTPTSPNVQILGIGGTFLTNPPQRLDMVQGGREIEITISPSSTWKMDGTAVHADVLTNLKNTLVGSGTSFNQFLSLVKAEHLSVYGGATSASVLKINFPAMKDYNNGSDEEVDVIVKSNVLASGTIDETFPISYKISNKVNAFAPGAPWSITIKNNDPDTYRCVRGFTIAWKEPYGYPTEYEVQRDQGREEHDGGTAPNGDWVTFYTGPLKEAKATGLNRDFWYRIRIKAKSALGTGDWSDVITVNTRSDGQGKSGNVPNSRPIKPVAVTEVGVGATSMTVKVTPNTVCPDDIQEYVVVYRDQSMIESQITAAYGAEPMRFEAKVTATKQEDGSYHALLKNLSPSTSYTVGAVAVAETGDDNKWKANLHDSYDLSAGTLASEGTDLVTTKITTLDPLTVKDVPTPKEGPIEGNTLITVTGNGFYKGVKCKIGSADAVEATVQSKTQLTCRTPRSPDSGVGDQMVTIVAISSEDDNSKETTIRHFHYHSSLLVSDFKSNSVLRFHADTGAFVDTFVSKEGSGLDGPWGVDFSPNDKNFYVASEGKSQVLRFNGNTGAFIDVFCTVKGQPRGLVFHMGATDVQADLYVASAYQDAVFRYNGKTGASRGKYASDANLDNPWGLVFSKEDDVLMVSSEYTDKVLRFDVPPKTRRGADKFKGQFKDVYTDTRVNYANGLDLNEDSLYVTGPYSGQAIVRFNRFTGKYIGHFHDPDLKYPVDLKLYHKDENPNSTNPEYIYCASENEIRKYHSKTGEFLGVHAEYPNLMASSMMFHKNWNTPRGK